MFYEAKNTLVFKKGNETLMIEPWGKDSLRVRSTLERDFLDLPWGLTQKVASCQAKIEKNEQGASITNGRITAKINTKTDSVFYLNISVPMTPKLQNILTVQRLLPANGKE